MSLDVSLLTQRVTSFFRYGDMVLWKKYNSRTIFVLAASAYVLWMYNISPLSVNQMTHSALMILAVAWGANQARRRRLSERDVINTNERALESLRVKTSFLANMSHEIRTPLNGVVGMTTLLLTTKMTAEQRDYAESIQVSGKALLHIVNDILDLSKIESKKLELEAIPFRLRDLVSQSAKMFAALAMQKGLRLELNVDPSIAICYQGDPSRIQQILGNLISNAIRFTDTGQVSVSIKPKGPLLQFEVEDTGIGIAPDALGRLFKTFAQADSSTTRKYGGSGLGLSISKQLVELMGGQIGVESDGQSGSVFWFRLPLIALSPERADTLKLAAPLSEELLVDHAGKRSGRILLAEDNIINQKFSRKLLENLGYQVTSVANGQEVLEELTNHEFDLILMDCHMPEMDGYEATIAIRSNRVAGKQTIPIIAVTANALKDEAEKCLQIGMNDYVSKPIELDAMIRALDRWMPKKKESVIDYRALEKIVALDINGGPAILKEFIALFTGSFDQRIANMKHALQTQEGDLLFREAHTLMPNCSYLGAYRMSDICRELEVLGKERNFKTAALRVQELLDLYGPVKQELDYLDWGFFEVKSA